MNAVDSRICAIVARREDIAASYEPAARRIFACERVALPRLSAAEEEVETLVDERAEALEDIAAEAAAALAAAAAAVAAVAGAAENRCCC